MGALSQALAAKSTQMCTGAPTVTKSLVRNRHVSIRYSAKGEGDAKELIKAAKKKMIESPDEWRQEVAPFGPGVPKGQKLLAQVKLRDHAKSYTCSEKINKKVCARGKHHFRRRHYVRYHKKWGASDTDEANTTFDKLRGDQEQTFDFSDGSEGVDCENIEGRGTLEETGQQTRTGFPQPLPLLDPNGVISI